MARMALFVAVLASTRVALAQTPPPLSQIKDEKQLGEALASITQDPAISVDDPARRPLAQALMIEGVKQWKAKAYDQALANFLDAYSKVPSPKILLEIASTLRDMGRLADAANTYQRYLADPATGSERVGDVKQLLIRLDEVLTILTVRVFPRGSDVSIDAGAFIPVGTTLVTRVRPGMHLLRIRKGQLSSEVTVNGFEGETKEVSAALEVPPDPAKSRTKPVDPPDHQHGWLITGQYASEAGTGNTRGILTRTSGEPVVAIVPELEISDDGDVVVRQAADDGFTSGLAGVLRIDAEGRGFAGGLGLAISRGRFEADIMVLRSNVTGGYLGVRYRFLLGFLRPYAAVGMPGFVFDNEVESPEGMVTTETKLALGVRAAGGIELHINSHLSVQADVGFEHFWFVNDTKFVENVWVPTVGVIGRL